MTLGQVLSDANLRQLRMSESEKERFVTFYFNGQFESPFPGEERLITPSPAVAIYDAKPEMAAFEQTEKLIAKMQDGNEYAFVLINFANPDMVGHTGNIGPAVKSCEVVDQCVGKIANYISAYGGTFVILADHGNVEEMINAHTGEIDTEHSTNTVPFIVVSREFLGKSQTLPSGILADVAPTILALLGISKPISMTGRNLLEEILKYK
jgi:2,3-bisphosphoglycerate-independent phosphoglycerate mutase